MNVPKMIGIMTDATNVLVMVMTTTLTNKVTGCQPAMVALLTHWRMIGMTKRQPGKVTVDKIKTHFARIIVSGTAEKPYYHIMWYSPADRDYHIGYSSFDLAYVFKWLAEEFEIVNKPQAAVEVKADTVVRCAKCQHYDRDYGFCQFWHGIRPAGHYCREGMKRDDG